MSTLTVGPDKVVTLQYILTDKEGTELDRCDVTEPFLYLHGHGNIVPGLENALLNKSIGDRFQTIVAAKDGYGVATGYVESAPRSFFPSEIDIEIGMDFFAEGPDGSVMPLFVVDIKGDDILVTPDHPLAGVDLHFDVEVIDIRGASDEELTHGHPHGPGGHSHHS